MLRPPPLMQARSRARGGRRSEPDASNWRFEDRNQEARAPRLGCNAFSGGVMNARNWGLLLLLALLWGSSFFFYKVLVAALPPITVVLGRVGIAAIAMNLWLAAQGQHMPAEGRLWLRF